ncbi:MAG: hypothetical protein OEL20_17855 [Sulfuritalea sp.]|nr:hypothetical protein [Sulfuritalea sp.]
MAISNSIPAHTVDQIVARLNFVAMTLRSMRDLAVGAGDGTDYEAVSVAVIGLSERAHHIVDACIMKMGDMGLGMLTLTEN